MKVMKIKICLEFSHISRDTTGLEQDRLGDDGKDFIGFLKAESGRVGKLSQESVERVLRMIHWTFEKRKVWRWTHKRSRCPKAMTMIWPSDLCVSENLSHLGLLIKEAA